MHTQFIKSLQHPTAKHFSKLIHDKKYRQASKTIVISCDKVIEEISNHVKPICIIDAETDILRKITKLPSFSGSLAEFPMPLASHFQGGKRVLILDGISDPGNMGTLIRTAAALNFDAVYILPSSTDPFNDKALRSARAAPFFIQIYQGSYEELLKFCSTIYIADMKGTPLENLSFTTPLALVLGNESKGVSDRLRLVSEAVCIPMNPRIESFNVATAGAIMMYVMRGPI
jgi:TrmH family RNA methyltransferase